MPAEMKILERAEMYLRKLSCGVNPVTEESLSENDACKQERISKCLAYVAAYLQQKIAPDFEKKNNQGTLKQSKQLKVRVRRERPTQKLELSPEILAKFNYSEEPLSVSNLVRRINSLIPEGSSMISLMYADVAEMLSQEGVLSKESSDKGKEMNLPTKHGEELGFSRAEAVIHGHNTIYSKCNVNAQKFVIENIQKCIDQANERFLRRNAESTLDGDKRTIKEKFKLTEEQIKKYPLEESAIPASEIARRLNELLDRNSNIGQIYFKRISDWFYTQNYLEEKTNVMGKSYFVPTELGISAGVVTEKRIGQNGQEYDAVLYSAAAQKLLLEHVNELA